MVRRMQIRHEVTGLRLATLAVIAAVFAPSVAINAEGQWLTNQTPGIPRTADGKVDLTAPAPRLADGKPDLSGVWRSQTPGAATVRNYMDGVNPPLQPWAEALAKTRATGDGKDDPTALCLPLGHPRSVAFSMQKIVQTPTLVVVLYEFFTTFRQIFVDGRKLPVDPQPAWGDIPLGDGKATRWSSRLRDSTTGVGLIVLTAIR
jgi:hypothetical protein